ncbi:MAG: hypothetical protein JWS10_3182 [Cypionkella sp.]|uniref:hypothetical protein n=1 Tax=Cypionkella sp. TaxID=2811411 RepID=UPI00262E03FA|nr:hypothetical protein [Cypionkella sp.]MDB5660567.1 hypothetical protein [Cypionkella sp.]
MKPAFALDFRDETISLLHRSGSGWQLVGAVPLDTPDLTEALGYLRATALGLSPRGLETKVVIPNEQVLYLTVHAPGPDAASRHAQVTAALQGRTPYEVADLAFDYSGTGPEVQVAVIAKETLAEAEGFAAEHRLNPIAFVASPEDGTFDGEPWFGLSAMAPSLVSDDSEVERDTMPVMMASRGSHTAVRSVAEPEAEFATTFQADPQPEFVLEDAPVAEFEVETAPEAFDTPDAATGLTLPLDAEAQPAYEAQPAHEPEPAYEPEPVYEPQPAYEPKPAPPFTPEPEPTPFYAGTLSSEPEDILAAAEMREADTVAAQPELRPAARNFTPDPGLAAEIAAASPEAATPDGIAKPALPTFIEAQRGDVGPEDDSALIAALADTLSAPIAQPVLPRPAPPESAKPLQPEADEAPMALDVADESGDDDSNDLEEAEPQGAGAIRAALSAKAARVIDPAIAEDLPPLPSAAALGAFSSRRQGNDLLAGKAPALGAAKAAAQRPSAAKPLAGMQSGDMQASSAMQPSAMQRPGLQRPEAAVKPAKSGKPGLRGLSNFATPPSNGAVKPRSKVAIPSALPPLKSTESTGANSAANPQPPRPATARSPGGFAPREPVKGKPRYLGLVLTVVLLFLLAMIAAWSSYSMGAWNIGGDQPVEVGAADSEGTDATDIPDANDEMLADMQDPAELSDTASVSDPGAAPVEDIVPSPDAADAADQVADAMAEPATEAAAPAAVPEPAPAPALDVAAETAPPVNSTTGTDDEIFLASTDAAPVSPDPLSLEQPLPQGDQLPTAQPSPPPFGTVYQFEANGAIKPTPEGIITPEGVLLRAGKPALVPTERPATVAAAAAAAKPAVTNPTLPEVALPTATAPPVLADPALAGKKPKTRPAGLVPASTDQGALAPVIDSRLAGLRPSARPPGILSAGRQAQQASAGASLAAQAEQLNQEAALSGGSKLAVAISRKPATRPRDLSRAVEAAVAAVARQPEPEPEPVAEPKPKVAAAPEKNTSAEADGEPEIASAAPKIPTKATVAKQATFKNAINLSKLNLIGVYGTQSKRYALVRTAAGRYKKVRVGDSIDGGGRVAAITATEVRYQKGGRLVALAMPKS